MLIQIPRFEGWIETSHITDIQIGRSGGSHHSLVQIWQSNGQHIEGPLIDNEQEAVIVAKEIVDMINDVNSRQPNTITSDTTTDKS